MAVIPEFRGFGYGNLLMDYTEMRLEEQGVKLIELSIVAKFEKLQRFYERLGYIPKDKKSFPSLPFEVLFKTIMLIRIWGLFSAMPTQ